MNQQTQIWRILHIDDDEDDHIIVQDMLKEAQGRKVALEWAPTLEIGRQKLLENQYDAVLIDYDMGTDTGIHLIRELVAQGYAAPLILLTGRGSYRIDMEAMYAGATLYLTKNEINPLLLERSIRYAIERKQYEEENRRQKELLEQLIQAAPVAIAFLKGPQHLFELVNEQYTQIARGKGSVTGRSMAEVWPEIAEIIIPQLDHAFQSGEQFMIEDAVFTLLREGAWEQAYFTYSFIPIYGADGSIEGILNLAIETTTAVRERQAAQAQSERLEAVLYALPVGVWITDAKGNIIQKNQQADRIWAGDAPLSEGIEQYGQYQAWNLETGTKLEPVDYPVAQTIRSGEPVHDIELRIRRFDGSEGFVLVSVEPIKDRDGRMVGTVSINVDITDRKHAGSS